MIIFIYVALIDFQKELFYSLHFKSTHDYLLPLLVILLLFKFCSDYLSTKSSKGKFKYDHPIRMYFNSKHHTIIHTGIVLIRSYPVYSVVTPKASILDP